MPTKRSRRQQRCHSDCCRSCSRGQGARPRTAACGRGRVYIVAADSRQTTPKLACCQVPRTGALLSSLNVMGDSSWNPTSTQRITSCGARARSPARRRLSRSRTSEHLGFDFRWRPGTRACALQIGNRQQAAQLRPRQSQAPGWMSWRSRDHSRCGDAAQDAAARAVRDHSGHPRSDTEMNQAGRIEVRRYSVPEFRQRITAPRRSAIRAH